MTSKLVVNTIEADTGISSVSFASSISMSSTSKFHFGNAGIDIGADTNINRPSAGVLGFNINSSEKLRITSSGNIGAGTNNPDGFYTHAKNLVIGSGSSGEGITIFSGSSGSGYIGFNDTVSNGMQGFIQYNHNGDYMAFGPNGTEKVRITSGGQLNIGTDLTNSTYLISSRGTGHNRIEILSTDNNSAGIYLRTFNSGSQVSTATVRTDNSGNLQFYTAASGSEGERLSIDSVGKITTNTTGTITADYNSSNSGGAYFQYDIGANGANIGYIGAASHLIGGASNTDFGIRASNNLDISVGGSSRKVYIYNSGNIQLNTTGTLAVDFNSSNGAGAYFNFDIGASGANIGYLGAASHLVSGAATADLGIRSTQNFVISTGGASERLRIGSGGEVSLRRGGISATPSLEIYGSGNASDTVADNLRFHNWGNSSGDYWDVGVNHGLDANGNNTKPSTTLKAAAIRFNAKNGAVTLITSPASTSTQYEGLTQNENGYVTIPNQPSCMAYNAQGQHMSGNAIAQFNSTRFNIGSNYNSSNGRFTAPVAGRYLVAYSGLHDAQGQTYTGFAIRLNGSDFDGGEAYDYVVGSSNNHQCQLAKTLILNMSANDYVQIFIRSSGTQVHQRYGSFSVCLLT